MIWSSTGVNATLDDQITLVGYSLRSDSPRGLDRLRPGDRLVLDLYWQAQADLTQDFVVFTHLLGETHNPLTEGPVWGQHDGQPASGSLPTSRWAVGEMVVDRHVLPVDAGAPPGEYQLEVGLYEAQSGARLAVQDAEGVNAGDRVLLDRRMLITGR